MITITIGADSTPATIAANIDAIFATLAKHGIAPRDLLPQGAPRPAPLATPRPAGDSPLISLWKDKQGEKTGERPKRLKPDAAEAGLGRDEIAFSRLLAMGVPPDEITAAMEVIQVDPPHPPDERAMAAVETLLAEGDDLSDLVDFT